LTRRKIIFGVGAGAASIAVDGLAALISIHFLLKYLPAAEAGYWMLVTTMGGLLLLGQGAISPSIARHVAQGKFGQGQSAAGVRRLSWFIASVVMLIAVIAYFFYLRGVADTSLHFQAWLSWFCYAAGLVCSLHASARFAVLNGLGEVGWDKACRIVVSSVGVLLNWLILRVGWGITGMGLVMFLQGAASIIAAEILLRKQSPGPVLDSAVDEIRPLLLETGKLLSLSLIGYLVMNSGTFIIERRFGAEMVSRYAPLVRVGALLCNVAVLIPQTVYPYVARAWATQDYKTHKKLFVFGCILSIAGYLVGAGLFLVLAPKLMPVWLGPDRYLGGGIFALVLAVYAITVANIAFTNPVLASFGNAFVAPSIANLFLVLPLLWICTGQLGIIGAPVGMLAGSLFPSGWVIVRSYQLMNPRNGMPNPSSV
jgi:O-antigen/teichoic acid export membrane protein